MVNEILKYIPYEMKKSDFLNEYLGVLSVEFEKYADKIIKNSNYSIISNLSGFKLTKYTERSGGFRGTYSDVALRTLTVLNKYKYNPSDGIIDNFTTAITRGTGYLPDIRISSISGEINANIVIPPGVETEFIKEIDKKFVYGCKVNSSIKELVYKVYEGFGEQNDTGIQNFNIYYDEFLTGGEEKNA